MKAAVIEDQTLVRDYLAGLLKDRFGATEVLRIGSRTELAQRERELADARLILIDIDLGDGSTLDWAAEWTARFPGCRVVVVSSITGAFPYRRVQTAGISIAHKNDAEGDLCEVIRRTLDGAMVCSARVMDILRRDGRDAQSPFKLLSPREQRVLGLLGQRLSNEDIAAATGTAAATVADHRKRIMRKLGLHSIEEVIDYALRHGLVHDGSAAAARRKVSP